MQSASGPSGPPSAGASTTPTGMRGMGGPDDGDNRSRNAKAQRRHREKRKAHFKALEDSVSILTGQLEDARRQLSSAAYANSSRLAYSPESKDVAQLSAENAYLRDENADLRRQIYAMRVSYGREPSSAGGVSAPIMEIKQEGGVGSMYGLYGNGPPSAIMTSPRVTYSSHARTMSHPGDFPRDPAAESASTSSGSYPPPLYQLNTVVDDKWTQDPTRHSGTRNSSTSSRGRILSSSSAPSASPYVASAPFPTDPRAHALSTPTSAYPVRYDSAVYPAAPQHNMPRSAVSSSGPPSAGYAPNSAVLIPRDELAWGGQDPSAHTASSSPTVGPSSSVPHMVPGTPFTASPPTQFDPNQPIHYPSHSSQQHAGWSGNH